MFARWVAPLSAGFFSLCAFVSQSNLEGWLDSTNPYLDIEMMNTKTMVVKYLKSINDLKSLRKYSTEARQIEIDKEINELQKLKEDVKRTR